jgi:pSer/pThr/pTyr-binding forkhead associated (FHA) protein
MALILEIRDRRGNTTWHPLRNLPLTIGRGLSNDVILDDPYVDAQHVSVASDDTGVVTLQDLGSANGVLANGVRTRGAIIVGAGTELRIGRTTLRFRDRDESLPPAVVDASSNVPPAARWALTRGGSLATLGVVGALTALLSWLGNTERSSGTSIFAAVIAAFSFVAVWSGVWALAIRSADRRTQLRAHTAVVAVAFLTIMIYAALNEWLVFFFPDVSFFAVMYTVVTLAVLASLVVAHLTVAGALTRRQRWRAGLSLSGGLFLLIMLAGFVQEEKFSDVPKFPAQLKPIPPRFVPTHTVGEFVEAMSEARAAADKALDKQQSSRRTEKQ